MKEKPNLKRLGRRYQSESSKDTKTNNNDPQLVNDDGKVICPVPLINCRCPGEEPILGPNDSVFMRCTNKNCTVQLKPVHIECFWALEDEMISLFKHLGHKTSKWTMQHMRANLWDRKGLSLIERYLRCRCGHGAMIRDEDAWVAAEKELEKNNEGKRRRQKSHGSRNVSECSNASNEFSIAPKTPQRRRYHTEGTCK